MNNAKSAIPPTDPRQPAPHAQDVTVASSLEIDNRLHKNVGMFLRIKDPSIREMHEKFTIDNQALSTILSMSLMMLILSIAFVFILTANLPYCKTPYEYFLWFLFTSVIVLLNVSTWKVYYDHTALAALNSGSLSKEAKLFLNKFHKLAFLVMHLVLCLRLVTRVVNGQCHNAISNAGANFNCNPYAHMDSLPPEICSLVMLVPMVYCATVRGANWRFTIKLWAVAMASLLFCLFYARASNSATFVAYYALASYLVMADVSKLNFFLFFTHVKLNEILVASEKAHDEANAMEMRHMIANVAHDLKTPLASFLGGIEYISQVLEDISNKKVNGRITTADLEDLITSCASCVMNMRNTNSFMLMTINRCIDYTKASKGVKLVPKYETIDLMETLSMPLNCMKDIQQRVSILLEPVARDICSHVITDKQWLQENVLCLLSNAVKYSNEGEVIIRVTKVVADRVVTVLNDLPSSPRDSKSLQSPSSSMRRLNSIRMGDPSKVYCSPNHVDSIEEHEFLRFEIEDNGIGLRDEAMVSLFSPFKQAQRLAGGTGLGLFSMARRMEALEGRCGVEHRRDGQQGSLFWFMMPYRPDRPASRLLPSAHHLYATHGNSSVHITSSPRVALRGSLGTFQTIELKSELELGGPVVNTGWETESQKLLRSGGQLEILVVDDSPTILKMTTIMLQRHKHLVTAATNGADAVKKVQERLMTGGRKFDVILMDLQMPVMDGLEATRRLRALETRGLLSSASASASASASVGANDVVALTPTDTSELVDVVAEDTSCMPAVRNIIIGVSANSDTDTAESAYDMGMDAFVPKPFSLDTFYHTYDFVLAQRREQYVAAEYTI